MDQDMDYRMIRLLGFFSLLLSALFLAIWAWYIFRGESSAAGLAPVTWFVFFLFGTVTTRVASVLDRQADEIADLRRLLAERVKEHN